MIAQKTTKRIVRLLAAVLSFVMLLAVMPLSTFAAPPALTGKAGDNITYNTTFSGKTVTITFSGTGPMYDYVNSSAGVPWNQYSTYYTDINIVIGKGITHIGNYAFKFSYLTSLSIADTVESIGEYAFVGVTRLKSVDIPYSVKKIGLLAFNNSSLEKVTIHNTDIEMLIYSAFGRCNKITSFTIGLATYPSVAKVPTGKFVDVGEDAYFFDSVIWATENNVTNGTSNHTFSPDMACSRSQTVTFLWRASGEPEPKSTECNFTDIKTDDYFYKAVLWAAENGITLGTSDTAFTPYAPCTRAQVVTFLWRCSGSEIVDYKNPFSDVADTEAYYYNAVMWAASNGITTGTTKTTFAPDMVCTRAQIVKFLYAKFAKA